jgi:hypothetical protein
MAIVSATAIIISVLMIAGIIDTFSVVYFHSKREGFKCGTPLETTCQMINKRTDTVIAVARYTIPRMNQS